MADHTQVLCAEYITRLGPQKIRAFVQSLSPAQLRYLAGYWPFWARENQLPPPGAWKTWLLMGGRGSGKTRAGAEWIRAQIEGNSPLGGRGCHRVALVAPTLLDAREVMIEGDSGLRRCSAADRRPVFSSSRRRLEWPNGAVAYIFSSEDPDSLRGPQFESAWCDEFCSWTHIDKTRDMLRFGLRLGKSPRMVVTTTPRPIEPLRQMLSDPLTVTSRARTCDNRLLPDSFVQEVESRYGGTLLGRQELNGELVEDPTGALWNRDQIAATFCTSAPAMERIVVAVDPPASVGARAAECGIIVAGMTRRAGCAHAWVLADRTVQGVHPEAWARAAMQAYEDFDADEIVAEANQGGEMVRTVLGLANPDAPIKLVHASRAKHVRATPVAALYEQGRVQHCGRFALLEDQMCTFGAVEFTATNSPDRVDALVWAITSLVLDLKHGPRLRALI
ncbi:MAG: terminase family protein [Robiginitomaculum sp.]|nr:terminase family protein [Robiginitomaculum sp.]MDQ7077317.1 terminase family protein [Robiginitomaculum sp.]